MGRKFQIWDAERFAGLRAEKMYSLYNGDIPCKLLLFVMMDGWSLVCGGVVATFR